MREHADARATIGVPSPPDARAMLRILAAATVADRRSLDYALEGTLTAAAKDRKPRDYKVKRESALSPVPGLPGVMR